MILIQYLYHYENKKELQYDVPNYDNQEEIVYENDVELKATNYLWNLFEWSIVECQYISVFYQLAH